MLIDKFFLMLIWPRILFKSTGTRWVFAVLTIHCLYELIWKKPVGFVVYVTVIIERNCYHTGWLESFYKRQSYWGHPVFSLLRFIRFSKQVLSLQIENATDAWKNTASRLSSIFSQSYSWSLLKLWEAQRNRSRSLLHQRSCLI